MEWLVIGLGLAAVVCIHLGLSTRRKHLRELKRIKAHRAAQKSGPKSAAFREQRAFVNDLLRQENAAKVRGFENGI
jgi:hypothetical protein